VQLETGVEWVAAALAVWAVWRSVPRAPALDHERLLHVALSTRLRGEVEAAGGDLRVWEGQVLGAVLYHPAFRDPGPRLRDPATAPVPVPAREGERALLEQLGRLPDPSARLRAAWVEDPRVLEALLDDPARLGPAHDPATVLGPAVGWDAVAEWGPAVGAALGRRLGHVVVLAVGVPWAAALGAAAPGQRVVIWDALPETDPADRGVLRGFEALFGAASDRFVWVVGGAHFEGALRVLHAWPELRDRLLGVVAVAPAVSPALPWVEAHFTHEQMEPELQRAIPYLLLRVVDPEDPLATDWTPLPVPPVPESGRASIAVHELGVVPREGLSDAVLACGIWVLLAFVA
jgi:hypothetical protein